MLDRLIEKKRKQIKKEMDKFVQNYDYEWCKVVFCTAYFCNFGG